MKILIDMNLSPDWIAAFASRGIESVHWSAVGDPRAADDVIMDFARKGDYIVFTHDLDFGAMLALSRAESPSVIQVRAQGILPARLSSTVFSVLLAYEDSLEKGSLIVIDERRARVRVLPLQRRS